MDFGEKLSAARKAKDFSQEELAAKIEVSRQAISKWETGSAQPETANVLKLCEILEVSPNELFGFEEKVPAPKNKNKEKSAMKFLIICALIILFFAYLGMVGKSNPNVNSIRFPITSFEHSLVPEECTKELIAVEISFTPGNHKDGYSYSLSVFGDFPGEITTKSSNAEYDPETKTCKSIIYVPKEGESQIVAFVSNGRISGTNLFCFIEPSGENSYKLRTLGESYE